MPWDEVNQAEAIDRALKELRDQNHLASGDTVVVISSVLAVESIADSIQMRVVD
jgi:cell division protein ZapA (FtsZ GTPase activity inhibitor)